jgi:hypothetical protein
VTPHLKRPLAIAAVTLGAMAALAAPAQAANTAMTVPTAAVAPHTPGLAFPVADPDAQATLPAVGLPGTPSAAPAGLPPAGGPLVQAALQQNLDADDVAPAGPTLGATIKRIKLWQSLTCFGILVAAVPFARRFALRR